MKILHVVNSINPALGGPTQGVLNLVRALREQGIYAEIATTDDNGPGVLDVPIGERTIYKDVPVWFFPRSRLRMKEYIFSAGLMRWLWRNIKKYDIVCAHYLFTYSTTCTAVIANAQKVPYMIRTIGQLAPRALEHSKWKKIAYTAFVERHNLNHAAAIHCASKGEAEDAVKFGVKAPIVTIPLGVIIPDTISDAKTILRSKFAIPSDRLVVLFLGRLHETKRLELLIRAIHILAAKGLTINLLIAGSGETKYVETLKQLAAGSGIEDSIIFTGFASGKDKDILLQGSDIFIMPSLFESFGVAIAEAMAAGLPLVVSKNVQLSSEILEADTGLVADNTAESLSANIEKLLLSPDLRAKLGKNGRELAIKKYSWDTVAKEFIRTYTKILKGSNDNSRH